MEFVLFLAYLVYFGEKLVKEVSQLIFVAIAVLVKHTVSYYGQIIILFQLHKSLEDIYSAF